MNDSTVMAPVTAPSVRGALSSSPSATRRRLIVIVPGLGTRDWSAWQPFLDRLATEEGFRPQQATLLKFNARIGLLSRVSLETFARDLRASIDAEWSKARGFDEVILVGHSIGGAVARLAYLFAAGAIGGEQPSAWSTKVARIVLLASINRGVDPRDFVSLRLFAWITRKFRLLPHVVLSDVLRGSSAMTNMRINWIRHWAKFSAAREDSNIIPVPVIVQVLGTRDKYVRREDSEDLQAPESPIQIEIANATHASLIRLADADDPEGRYALLRDAFTRTDAPKTERQKDEPQDVVFILHGIRSGSVDSWIRELAKRIREKKGAITASPDYGYINAATFASRYGRRKYVNRFRDHYTETLARYPHATYHAIAHSNGTYMLGRSLSENHGMCFANVCLAGSVLPVDFKWDDLKKRRQVQHILNTRANRDWPVAFLCNLLRGLLMHDVGTGGFGGFEGQSVDAEIFYFNGGHSAALNPDSHPVLAQFALNGPPEGKVPGLSEKKPYCFGLLSRAMEWCSPLLVFALVALFALLCARGLFQPWGLIEILVLLILYVVVDIL